MSEPGQTRAAIERLRAGGLVVLVDTAVAPAEAVLVCAASRVSPEAINFMATHGRGLVCLAMTQERMRKLGIPVIPGDPGRRQPAYGASIEARHGVSTGISAADRN